MRLILVLMLSFSGVLGALGFPLLFTGTYLVGASMASLALGTAWYALRKGSQEAEHQRAYDLRYRERIDAYTLEVLTRAHVEVQAQ